MKAHAAASPARCCGMGCGPGVLPPFLKGGLVCQYFRILFLPVPRRMFNTDPTTCK
jgi:hypothetical protein